MDLPVADPGPMKEAGVSYYCLNCDAELVHKIAQLLLHGLATACVDNTTGQFKGPSSVAVDLRQEMVDFLIERSEVFIAESIVQGYNNPDQTREISDDPAENISSFIDDFASSKRNWLISVSGWLMSESRENKIDDFVQEMETNGFWFMDRREAVAAVLLKNADYKNTSHCSMKFHTEQELEEHKLSCGFRPVTCGNEGCHAKFCATHLEKHDYSCPYKKIPCEQKCPETLLRRDMDRHCITLCPMKLVNCPFFQIGCQSAFPQCSLEQHCSDILHSHLLKVLQATNKDAASIEELEQRVQLMEQSEFQQKLRKAVDVRSLTFLVKGLEEKMKKAAHEPNDGRSTAPATGSTSMEEDRLEHDEEDPFNLALGSRFKPTDEKLVNYFLRRRLTGEPVWPKDFILDFDVYQTEPWHLPRFQTYGNGKDVYYHTPVKNLSSKSYRVSRTAGGGHWHSNGCLVNIQCDGEIVGHSMKLKYIFKKGKEEIRTHWLMREFRLARKDRKMGDIEIVLCRIRDNNRGDSNFDQEAVGKATTH